VATAEIEGVMKDTNEGVLNRQTMQSCRYAAHKMEDLLFSVGGAERIVVTLQYFRGRRTVRELDNVIVMVDGKTSNNNNSNEGRLHLLLMDGLKNILGMFTDKSGGRRSLERTKMCLMP